MIIKKFVLPGGQDTKKKFMPRNMKGNCILKVRKILQMATEEDRLW